MCLWEYICWQISSPLVLLRLTHWRSLLLHLCHMGLEVLLSKGRALTRKLKTLSLLNWKPIVLIGHFEFLVLLNKRVSLGSFYLLAYWNPVSILVLHSLGRRTAFFTRVFHSTSMCNSKVKLSKSIAWGTLKTWIMKTVLVYSAS